MQRLNLYYGPRPLGLDRQASMLETHRSFTLTVGAIRRANGVVIVNATLAGGRERLVRSFCTVSEYSDPIAACEHAVAELRRVVNHLLAVN